MVVPNDMDMNSLHIFHKAPLTLTAGYLFDKFGQ